MPELPFVERFPSWEHQVRAREWALGHWAMGHPGLLLACDMGTGKSKIIIDLASTLPLTCMLILCPLRVIEVWEFQFQQHAVFPYLFAALDDRVKNTEKKESARRRRSP